MEPGGLIGARAACYLALLLVAGLPLHALAAGRPLSGRGRFALAVLALGGAVASAWWALESVAAMAGPVGARVRRAPTPAVAPGALPAVAPAEAQAAAASSSTPRLHAAPPARRRLSNRRAAAVVAGA